jgi:hydroxymethylbilane synthase
VTGSPGGVPGADAARIRIGTRGSALALAQARLVEAALVEAGEAVELVIVETDGDRRQPDTAWGEGAFVAAIERALLENRADVAVHSAKDVPTAQDPRLAIAAFLPRSDPRDALVVRDGDEARSLADLPSGARVGTDSPRRQGFLLAVRPDLMVHPLHGNVDTRLRRLDAGETDALVLAAAGLLRLGLENRIAQHLDPEMVPPAPGQGAIAVQVRSDDERTTSLVSAIDDWPTRAAVEAERAFLAASGGGCRAPIGGLARVQGDTLTLLGGFTQPEGASTVFHQVQGPADQGARLGALLARELAAGMPGLRLAEGGSVPVRVLGRRPRVLLTRAVEQQEPLARALEDVGIEAVRVPAIAIHPVEEGDELDRVIANLDRFDWIVVTSANGAAAVLAAAARLGADPAASRWAAVGPSTAAVLEGGGVEVAHRPRRASGADVAMELPIESGQHVLLARGDLADPHLPQALRDRGAEVTELTAYRTQEAPPASRALLAAALQQPLDAVLFASGSAVRGLIGLARPEDLDAVRRLPALCIGPETERDAQDAGFHVLRTAPMASAEALARTTAETLADTAARTRVGTRATTPRASSQEQP